MNDNDDVATDEELELERRPTCAACQECHDRLEDVGPGVLSWEHIPELLTPQAVTDFEGLTKNTQEKHIAETDGILARYDLGENVICSLKGAHRHQKGIVVRTLCDLVLCMGFRCGAQSIIGFDKLQADLKRRVSFEADQRQLRAWYTDFGPRVESLRKYVKERREVVDALTSGAPDLARELRNRAKNVARGSEIDGAAKLAGLQIFNLQDTKPLDAEWRKFRSLFDAEPPADGPACTALKRISAPAENRYSRLLEWLRDSAAFVTLENLQLAASLIRNGSARQEGSAIIVGYLGAEAKLSPLTPLPESNE